MTPIQTKVVELNKNGRLVGKPQSGETPCRSDGICQIFENMTIIHHAALGTFYMPTNVFSVYEDGGGVNKNQLGFPISDFLLDAETNIGTVNFELGRIISHPVDGIKTILNGAVTFRSEKKITTSTKTESSEEHDFFLNTDTVMPNTNDLPQIIIKFKDGFSIPNLSNILNPFLTGFGLDTSISELATVLNKYKGILFQTLPNLISNEGINTIFSKANKFEFNTMPNINLNNFQFGRVPADIDCKKLIKDLQKLKCVEYAYQPAPPTNPPFVFPFNDPMSVKQGYLKAGPDGINALSAWLFGADGSGIQFTDIEQGWTLNHEDLPTGLSLQSGTNNGFFGHGTAVLGEVVGVDNGKGVIGIAPNAKTKLVSQFRTATQFDTGFAILDAIIHSSFGDVVLLEAQTTYNGKNLVPVEVEPFVFDMIRLATWCGIIIIEAGGNGGNDLDSYKDPTLSFFLNRGNVAFKDSGAILVGAASGANPHTRLGFSNFGSRIDCYAWGEKITSTGDGWIGNLSNTYTDTFGGTSGASPIITGAAILTQQLWTNRFGTRLNPLQMRAILKDPKNGTTSATPATDKIGVMPDLGKIMTNVIATGTIPSI